ncbi:MAG: DNA gyrase inhibitor YacG [Burkholderiaceae bacterium]
MAGSSRVLLVDCPACARKTEYSPANRWRPFCSERCKRIDLGAWASEQYRIAGAPLDPTDPAEAGTGPATGAPPSSKQMH